MSAEEALSAALYDAANAAWESLQASKLAGCPDHEAYAEAAAAAVEAALPMLSQVIRKQGLKACYAEAIGMEAVAMVRERGRPPAPGGRA